MYKFVKELGKIATLIIIIQIFVFIDVTISPSEYSFVVGVLCGVVCSTVHYIMDICLDD